MRVCYGVSRGREGVVPPIDELEKLLVVHSSTGTGLTTVYTMVAQ